MKTVQVHQCLETFIPPSNDGVWRVIVSRWDAGHGIETASRQILRFPTEAEAEAAAKVIRDEFVAKGTKS